MPQTTTSDTAGDHERAIVAFRRRAFAALLAGEAPRLADITEAASRDTHGVAHAVAWLEEHGQLERDGDLLVGAHGLTRRTTPHALTIEGRRLYTWCAYEAVAIPVALGASARATTTCPACRGPLIVDVDAGHVPDAETPVLWMPIGPCERLIEDFCAHANLFCTRDHLDDWRYANGDPTGQVVNLAEIPALARAAWADVATHQGTRG
jgi:alkylmercury lyase